MFKQEKYLLLILSGLIIFSINFSMQNYFVYSDDEDEFFVSDDEDEFFVSDDEDEFFVSDDEDEFFVSDDEDDVPFILPFGTVPFP